MSMKNVKFTQFDINEIAAKRDMSREEFLDKYGFDGFEEHVNNRNAFYAAIKPVRKGYYIVRLNASYDVATPLQRDQFQNVYLRGEMGKPGKNVYWFGPEGKKRPHRLCSKSSYGVADTLPQIYEFGVKFIHDYPASDFVCLITPMVKAEQSSQGGWRYHKWGQFIGKRELGYEYLYDDVEAPKEVYCFHFYALERKA